MFLRSDGLRGVRGDLVIGLHQFKKFGLVLIILFITYFSAESEHRAPVQHTVTQNPSTFRLLADTNALLLPLASTKTSTNNRRIEIQTSHVLARISVGSTGR